MSRSAYEWRVPRLFPVSAQVVGEHLEQLRKQTKITPKTVVAAARSPRSPLHRCFEWNDGKAAENYRLRQARDLVGNLIIHIKVTRKSKPAAIRAFVHVHSKNDGAEYVGVRAALKDHDMRAQVLRSALKEVQQWRERYADLQELCSIFHEVDRAAKQIEKGTREAS